VDVRGLEELLGRDAPAVQARAADLVLLDDGYPEAGRCAVQRCGVPPGSTTDDDDVERFSPVG
jgi:hypothetical protein